jgi:ABC-type multidrug transport system fused ATPase/permease subunit
MEDVLTATTNNGRVDISVVDPELLLFEPLLDSTFDQSITEESKITSPNIMNSYTNNDKDGLNNVANSCFKNSSIEFCQLYMRYASNLPHALCDISLMIPAGSRVAIVGRTGTF